MDAIEDLDIHLDLSDRKFYYDFLHSAVVTSPMDAKDKAPEDKGVKAGCLFKNDVHELRVAHISRAHYLDKRFYEKFAPSKNSEQEPELGKDDVVFGGEFSKWGYEALPRYALPLYKPGETVRGTVVINLKKELEAECLTINLLGRASVNVRIYHRYGYYDDTKHEQFVDETQTLWRSPKAPKDDEGFTKLVPNDRDLGPGRHELPFQFTIPVDANSSIVPLSPMTNNFCYLSYRLKATISKGKRFGRGNAVTCRGIWVNRPVNVLDVKDGMEPVHVEEHKETGIFSSGNITCRASLPRSAFCANAECSNEVVPLTLEIDNHSGKAIDEVSAKIRCMGRGKTGTHKLSIGQSFKLTAVGKTAGPISPGECPKYNWDLKFDFSESFLDSCNIPPTQASAMSTIIDFRYEVFIKLKRSGPHRNMEVIIPITVCAEHTSPMYPELKGLSIS